MVPRRMFVFLFDSAVLLVGCGASHDGVTLSIQIESASNLSGDRPWGGRVVSEPAGIDCTRVGTGGTRGSCMMYVASSASVVLHAEPDQASNSGFVDWS